MGNEETGLGNQIMVAVQKEFGTDVRMFRQNAGQAFTRPAFNHGSAYSVLMRYKTGLIGPDQCLSLLLGAMSSRPIQMAAEGAADWSGLLGPTGKRLELEVKTKTGRPSKGQLNWGKMITKLGGIYEIVHTPEEAIKSISKYL